MVHEKEKLNNSFCLDCFIGHNLTGNCDMFNKIFPQFFTHQSFRIKGWKVDLYIPDYSFAFAHSEIDLPAC